MFRWLTGPGSVFKDPLPGSTNYLNAYDTAGNLLRAKNMPTAATGADKTRPQIEQGEKEERFDENREKNEDEVAQDEASAGRKRTPLSEKLVKEREAAKATERVGVPKEKSVDLMPFPMNSRFRSHPILSEELRDEIYNRITEEKKSVRDVSAALGVEMRRVAAVVRLKAIEKQWEKGVC